jgi:hypothetical protein
VKSRVPPWVNSGVLRVSVGLALYEFWSAWPRVVYRDDMGRLRTLGIAYTRDPNADEEAESGVDVVRNSSKLGPLSVS